jgi:hypothetical protein
MSASKLLKESDRFFFSGSGFFLWLSLGHVPAFQDVKMIEAKNLQDSAKTAKNFKMKDIRKKLFR